MYCIKCGVGLSDTEDKCPLCGTEVYHPDIERILEPPAYPKDIRPKAQPKSGAVNGMILILFLLPLFIMLIIDWQMNKHFGWFGYAAGAISLTYLIFALPLWFQKPNPVVFTPISFTGIGLYLLYINLATGGDWFLSFAFPVTGCLGLIVTAVVTLTHYIRRGRLFIYGGMTIALGGFVLLIEFLTMVTFGFRFKGWSLYPLSVLGIIGCLLLYLAINPQARETLERKFFI